MSADPLTSSARSHPSHPSHPSLTDGAFFPRAVIFDMDGLMLDSEVVYRDAWFATAAEFGVPMEEATFRRFLGRGATDALALLAELYGPEVEPAHFMRRGYEMAFDRFAPGGMPPKPGLEALLTELEIRGIPRGIATSTRRPVALRSLAGLESRFHSLTTGDEVSRGKPEPDIFLLAASRLQVEPEHCLVLEDSEAGVRAGHAAGMQVIMVPDLVPASPETAALARVVLPSLHGVREWLLAID